MTLDETIEMLCWLRQRTFGAGDVPVYVWGDEGGWVDIVEICPMTEVGNEPRAVVIR